MKLTRHELTLLFNALYEAGVDRVTVAHPCEAIGDLLEIELGDPRASEVRFTQGALTYADNRATVRRRHGDAADDLPDAQHYVDATIAGGVTDVANQDEIAAFVDRYGYPDLAAGHHPVFAGIDTNLFPWRIQTAIGIDPETGPIDDADRPPTNGYALATGVKAELDWHYKHYDTHHLVEAFGPAFDRVSDQPAGPNRQGFLGLYEYRRLMAERRVDVVDTGTGDDAIVEGYADYAADRRVTPLLFSNDYGFVEQATDAGLHAHHVDIPVDLPRSTTASWSAIEDMLYYLAVAFGVLTLPKVTVYGVWDGKTGRDWQTECLDIDPRSPAVEATLERDKSIVATTVPE